MNKTTQKILSTQVAQQQATKIARRHIDIPLGFALLRDRRVPIQKKILALLIGILGAAVLLAIEFPLELLAVIFAIPFGIVDGLEVLILPVFFACASLPRLTPLALMDQIRAERVSVRDNQRNRKVG